MHNDSELMLPNNLTYPAFINMPSLILNVQSTPPTKFTPINSVMTHAQIATVLKKNQWSELFRLLGRIRVRVTAEHNSPALFALYSLDVQAPTLVRQPPDLPPGEYGTTSDLVIFLKFLNDRLRMCRNCLRETTPTQVFTLL